MSDYSPFKGFFAELKRRRVFRVMAVYGAGAFVALQVIDLLVPVLLLPPWVYRLIGVVLIAGFPLAVGLAWVFDVGPTGVTRTEEASREELAGIIAAPRRQRWPAGLLALAGVVLFAVGGWWALTRSGKAAGSEAGGASLAVLPFANLARSAETEPFVEGIHDDLLTQLSKIHTLKVISRTSVLEYRETRKNIRQIGSELGVRYVMEGGVQRAGDQVRINVQLIDASTDEHVWAETYNRTLTVADIFAVQSDIASAISSQLRTRLTPAERESIGSRPTQSLEAYDHLQRGAAYFRLSQVPSEVRKAVAELEAATRIDPAYADAWERLAIARLTLGWEWGQAEQVPLAEEAVRRVEELAPGQKAAYLARGYLEYYGHRNYAAALAALQRAESLAPEDPQVLGPIAWVYRRLGEYDRAVEYFRRSFARDPRNYETVLTYAWTMVTLRRWDEAERLSELVVSLAPQVGGGYQLLALLPILRDGDTSAADRALARATGRSNTIHVLLAWPPLTRILAHSHADEIRAATSAVADDTIGYMVQWQTSGLTPAAFFLQKAEALRVLGDSAAARIHFDSARAVLEPRVRARESTIWNYQADLPGALGIAYAGLGRKEEALRYGRAAVASIDGVEDRYMSPRIHAQLAEILLLEGDRAGAVAELERVSAATGLFSGASLGADPLWRPLASEPRFRALAARR